MDEKCHVEPFQKSASNEDLRRADRALLSVGGMGCPNCAARVRNGLLALEGVYAANVYLNLAVAEVYYNSGKLSTEALERAVEQAGNDGHHEYYAVLIAAE